MFYFQVCVVFDSLYAYGYSYFALNVLYLLENMGISPFQEIGEISLCETKENWGLYDRH